VDAASIGDRLVFRRDAGQLLFIDVVTHDEIARAKGMSQVARDAGLSRESLYKALSEDGNPSFATVLKVARALGVRLHAGAA
jgi:probable addiction module antidote protein